MSANQSGLFSDPEDTPSASSEVSHKRTAAYEEITPEIAAQMLRLNLKNRKISKERVAELARQMTGGTFLDNGDSISFTWEIEIEGTDRRLPFLADGQHRLQAIVESGVTLELLVVRGLDPRSQATKDTGFKRTANHNFTINGEKEAATLGAITSAFWKWKSGDSMFLTKPAPTVIEQQNLLDERPELRRSLEVACQTHYRFRGLKKSSLGVAHAILSEVSPTHVPYFFSLIETGANLETGHPVLALREAAMSYKLQGSQRQPMPIRREVGLIVAGWNKCVNPDKNGTKTLSHPVDKPIPDPLAPMGEYIPLLEDAQLKQG